MIADLAQKLGVDIASIDNPAIKNALRTSTDHAIANGVFGVPTFRVRGQLFWGSDSLSFVEDYLADPTLFDRPEMQRASNLPTGVERKSGA